MNSKILYLVAIALVVVCGVAAVVSLYRVGGSALPGWVGFVSPGPLSNSHAFLERSCESCHIPTRGVEASSCKGCHANNSRLLGRQPTSFHASIVTCSGCHVEHQGRPRPINMDHAVLLSSAFSRSEQDQSVSGKLASFANSLRHQVKGHDASRALDCASCHVNKDPHRKLFGSDCGACHAVAGWKIATYRHPSPNSNACAQCHQAPPSHYMMHFEMISRPVARQEHAKVSECGVCHQTDAWNNIRGVGWYKHH